MIFTFLAINLLNILIQPFNLILGIICVLFLPGFNLISLIKPRFNLIEKLGYSFIISIAIENFIMFFGYFFLYDLITTPNNPQFVFNDSLLTISIQVINVILLGLNQLTKKGDLCNLEDRIPIRNYNNLKEKINLKILLCYIGYLAFLLFLCLSSINPKTPNSFWENFYEYKEYFTFFFRVPFTFYIFLILSIILLTVLVFYSKNLFFVLLSISSFLYVIWILPYLQINNFFSNDAYVLSLILNGYPKYGIRAMEGHSFILFIDYFFPHRYSTSFFTGIIIMSACNVDVNFTLFYIFPLLYFFLPFLLYSIFQKYSNQQNFTSKKLNIILLTIFAILTPQFIKFAHSATTGIIGIIVFFMLVIEFFELIQNNSIKFDSTNFVLIVLLYFFLCLTHTEECFYFLILVVLYIPIYLLFNLNYFKESSIKNDPNLGYIKRNLKLTGLLLIVLSTIFYFTQEFFGWINGYLDIIIGQQNHFISILMDLYRNFKIDFIFNFRGNFELNYFVLGAIILIVLFYIYLSNLIFSRYAKTISKIIKTLTIFLRKWSILVKRIISTKIFQIILIPLVFIILIIINVVYVNFLRQEGLALILELILTSVILIIHIFLFLKGVTFYNTKNQKQVYYLLAIFSSSVIMVIFFIIGNTLLTLYVLNYRFFTYFAVFNLIIIENAYFDTSKDRKKLYWFILIISLLFLGTLFSLGKLAYG